MTDPRIPANLFGYQQQGSGRKSSEQKQPEGTKATSADPLGWCVIATTALLAWLVGPIALAFLAAIGFVKYWLAWRSGRTDSSCILGDVRIVLAYLFALAVIGAVATAVTVF